MRERQRERLIQAGEEVESLRRSRLLRRRWSMFAVASPGLSENEKMVAPWEVLTSLRDLTISSESTERARAVLVPTLHVI